MEEIVLKRLATITSADALDEISDAYPDAEILSFRRIKEAGTSSEFFVARLRSAAMADEQDDVVLDSEDVVIEDKQHEDKEEKTMNKIVELLTDVLAELKNDSEPGDEGMEDMQMEMEEMPVSDMQDTIPGPDEDLQEKYQNIPPSVKPAQQMGLLATVLSRDADVSKKIARIELIREVADQGYKVHSIEKIGNKYYATLFVAAEDDENSPEKKFYGPYVNPEAKAPRFRMENPWVGDAIRRKKAIDEIQSKMTTPDPEIAEQLLPLKPDMERWLLWREQQLRSSGYGADESIDILDEEYELLKNMPGEKQRRDWMIGKEESEEPTGEAEEKPGRRGPAIPDWMQDRSDEEQSEYRSVKERLKLLKGESPTRTEEFIQGRDIDWSDEESIDWSGISKDIPKLPSDKKKKQKGAPPKPTQFRMSALEMMKRMYYVAFDEDYSEKVYADAERELTEQVNIARKELEEAQKSGDEAKSRQAQVKLNRVEIQLERVLHAKDELATLLDTHRDFNQEAFINAYEQIQRIEDPKKQVAWLRRSPYWEGASSIYRRNPGTTGLSQKSKPLMEKQQDIFKSEQPFDQRREELERYERNVPRPKPEPVEDDVVEKQPELTKEEQMQLRQQQIQQEMQLSELRDMREEFGIPPKKKWSPTKEQLSEWEKRVQEAGY